MSLLMLAFRFELNLRLFNVKYENASINDSAEKWRHVHAIISE